MKKATGLQIIDSLKAKLIGQALPLWQSTLKL